MMAPEEEQNVKKNENADNNVIATAKRFLSDRLIVLIVLLGS